MSTDISLPSKMRDSNMELLRIVAMIMVMALHANQVLLPVQNVSLHNTSFSFSTVYVYVSEALSIVCVNAFIMISGWYSIRFRLKRLLELIFMVYFFSIIMCFLFPSTNGYGKDLTDILLLRQYGCGFIPSYILLYILSPILNNFVDTAEKKKIGFFLLLFFGAQTVFSFINNFTWYFDGFSPLPWIGLYILARYLKLYPGKLSSFSAKIDFIIYFVLSCTIAIGSIILISRFGTGGRLFNYTNPLVILSSAYLVLFFSKLKIKSRWINWLGVSTLSAMLIHLSPGFINEFFYPTIDKLFSYNPYLYPLLSLVFFIIILLVGCTADKIRIYIWNLITRRTTIRNR